MTPSVSTLKTNGADAASRPVHHIALVTDHGVPVQPQAHHVAVNAKQTVDAALAMDEARWGVIYDRLLDKRSAVLRALAEDSAQTIADTARAFSLVPDCSDINQILADATCRILVVKKEELANMRRRLSEAEVRARYASDSSRQEIMAELCESERQVDAFSHHTKSLQSKAGDRFIPLVDQVIEYAKAYLEHDASSPDCEAVLDRLGTVLGLSVSETKAFLLNSDMSHDGIYRHAAASARHRNQANEKLRAQADRR